MRQTYLTLLNDYMLFEWLSALCGISLANRVGQSSSIRGFVLIIDEIYTKFIKTREDIRLLHYKYNLPRANCCHLLTRNTTSYNFTITIKDLTQSCDCRGSDNSEAITCKAVLVKHVF